MHDRPTSPAVASNMKPTSMRSSHNRPTSQHHSSHSPRKGGLNLPGLPRFHPANFPSTDSSNMSSPSPGDSGLSPHQSGPMSPRAQTRQISEAQRQLYLHQRESLNLGRGYKDGAVRPTSPKLNPLGSPGPVTPLELENEDGYLLAGTGASLSEEAKDQIVESYIQKEAKQKAMQQGGGQGSQHHRRGDSAHHGHYGSHYYRQDLAPPSSHRSTPSR